MILDWLLDSDPAIRWQVMRDLLPVPAADVAAERARIASEGFGAQLLARQAPDGRWGGAAWNHGWDSTMHVLTLLRELGLDPASPQARHALERVRAHVTWTGCGPPECDGNAFFDGEIEPCINGQVAAAGAYFGQDVSRIVARLLAEQLEDGGWNCEASPRSSFNTTICVLEALLECELAGVGGPVVTAARLRGQEYLLERRLFHRRSTGEPIERDRKRGADWRRFAFPTWWHYDVLRGLDHLRRACVTPDERVDEAIALVASKRDPEGRWPLDVRHAGTMPIEIDDGEGRASRWNTLRAMRVMKWASGTIHPAGAIVMLGFRSLRQETRRHSMKITIEKFVRAPIEEVWRAWTTPEDITQWNAASDDWHTTKASVDLRDGGAFSSRMEAKDGSTGFDFAGTYTKVEKHKRIEAAFGDRAMEVEFVPGDGGVTVRETFDAESENSVEQQRAGWQAILDNFAKHVESGR